MRLRTGDMRDTAWGLVSHVTSGARTVRIVFPCFHTCLLEFGLFLLVVSLKFQYYARGSDDGWRAAVSVVDFPVFGCPLCPIAMFELGPC